MNAAVVMPIKEVLSFIEETHGRFFSVRFLKRTDGTERTMTCRTGVRSRLSTNPSKKGIDFAANNLLCVFDTQADGYRTIPVEGITAIKIDGEWLPVVHD
jgi:hypothetical protein